MKKSQPSLEKPDPKNLIQKRLMTTATLNLLHQLTQLRELHASGVLLPEQYDSARAPLERRIIDDLLDGVVMPTSAVPVADPKPPKRRAGKAPLALAGLVVALAVAGYAWKGAPSQLGAVAASATPATAADGSASPHATNAEQIAAMADKLALRMQSQPEDAEGWAMLARSYSVLARYQDAEQAYRKATTLRADDAALWTDFADALAMNQGGKLAGEPMQFVEKALKLDPAHVKALSLSGTYAFSQKRYAEAAKLWQKVVDIGNPEDPVVKQSASSLTEARELAGLPAQSPSPPKNAGGVAAAGATVSGVVRLSAKLGKLTSPSDTVFIFARSADPAQRMPLAILRKQVKDLPYTFTLDDSLAMSAANPLSSSPKVLVGARVSKSGNAVPQAGDFSVLSPELALGTHSLVLEIQDAVKP